MNKIIKVRRGGFVSLKEFSDFFDISKIVTYTIKVNKDKSVSIKFYDSEKKLVRSNER